VSHDALDALELRILTKLDQQLDAVTKEVLRVERLLHSVFYILNSKADHTMTTQDQLVQDLADLKAAADAQSAASAAIVAGVTAAVAALDDLAKKIADAVAGAADFTALSNQVKAIKQSILDATTAETTSTQALATAVAKDDPPAPAATPPADTPPAATPPADTPPAATPAP